MQNKLIVLCCMCFMHLAFSQETTPRFSLEQAINFALENNYNAKVASNNIDAAKKKKWETTTIGLPQISANVDYQNFLKQVVSLLPAEITGGDPGTFVPVIFGTKQNLNASVTLNQLLFDGSYLVGLQSAKTYLKISELAKEKSDRSIREAVINAYGNVLVAEKSIDILEGNLSVLTKNVDDAQQIYSNGLNEEEDVEQLTLTKASVTSQLEKTKRLKEIAYQMLNLVLGRPIQDSLILSDSLTSLIEGHIDLQLLASTSNPSNHIDVQIAENDMESKRLLVLYEKSRALPSLRAFVNYRTTGNSNRFTFFDKDQEWFNSSLLGLSLNVPIFSSGQRSSKTQQAKINFENASIQLDETKQRIAMALASAKSDYQYSIEQYETATKNLRLATRIEQKQRVKFFEGVTSSFDLANAQNQLYTQQQNFVQSMMDVIAKKAALENALNLPFN